MHVVACKIVAYTGVLMALQFGTFVPQGWRLDLLEIADPVAKYEAMTHVAKAVDAIDKAARVEDVSEDIDRHPRGEKPDLGGHEFGLAQKGI